MRGFRAFLVIWLGQFASLVGSGLTAFAVGVRIYQESSSATEFALVSFFAAVPPLVALPLAGPLLDRVDRRIVLIVADAVAAAATLAILVLDVTGALTVWSVAVPVAVSATAGAVAVPAWSASITLLVPREHLGRASGLVIFAFSAAQIAAPALAGVLLPAIGLGGVIAIDVATFCASMAALAIVSIPRPEPGPGEERAASYLSDIAFGWRFIAARRGLAALLVFFVVTNFLTEVATVLATPLVLGFATPEALGTILAVGGAGGVAGSAIVSAWGGPRRRVAGVLGFTAIGGACVAAAGLRPSVALVAAASFGFFFCLPVVIASSQVIWQTRVPPALQGRVFAARTTVALAALPAAYLVAGPLVDRLFGPAAAPGGVLAGVSAVVAGGSGRGIALLFVVTGALTVATSAAALAYRPLRLVEEEIESIEPEPAHEPVATVP